MKKKRFYSEENLIQRYQDGEITMLYFVKHHTLAWKKQYQQFCEDNELPQNEVSAELFYEQRTNDIEKESQITSSSTL